MKVYEYFLINKPDELYAYTFDKKISKKFERNRLMNNFIYKTREIGSGYNVDIYTKVNEFQELIDFSIYNKHNEEISIVCPVHESLYSDELILQWYNTIPIIIDSVINDYGEYLKKSTVNQLLVLSAELKNMTPQNQSIISFNTLKLFENLF